MLLLRGERMEFYDTAESRPAAERLPEETRGMGWKKVPIWTRDDCVSGSCFGANSVSICEQLARFCNGYSPSSLRYERILRAERRYSGSLFSIIMISVRNF